MALTVNGMTTVSTLQTSLNSDYGSVFGGATKWLNSGDYNSLEAVYPSKLWMSEARGREGGT